MAKLKFKADGSERLILKGDEIRLVAALLEHVRLGAGDSIKAASCDILQALDGSELSDGMDFDHGVALGLTVEDQFGQSTKLSFNSLGYSLTLEATESYENDQPCHPWFGCSAGFGEGE